MRAGAECGCAPCAGSTNRSARIHRAPSAGAAGPGGQSTRWSAARGRGAGRSTRPGHAPSTRAPPASALLVSLSPCPLVSLSPHPSVPHFLTPHLPHLLTPHLPHLLTPHLPPPLLPHQVAEDQPVQFLVVAGGDQRVHLLPVQGARQFHQPQEHTQAVAQVPGG